MVSAAVPREEPVFSYSHNVSANPVMLLPSCDILCVLQSIKKSLNSNNSFFFNFISLLPVFHSFSFLKQKQSLRISA